MNHFHRWPPLNCLKGFEAAARLGSFSRAAEELHMTQSAVSHQVKTLESYLEQDLFLRVNRRVVLSDAGTDLLGTVEECLALFATGLKRLEQYRKPNQVIIHTSSAFAAGWLVPRLAAFRQQHPDNDVWLYTTDGEPDLDLEEVHAAVLYGDGKWPGVVATRLLSDALVPLCAPGHPLLRQPDRSPLHLLDHTLLHGEQRETWQTWFSRLGRPDINPIAGPNFTNAALMLQAARLGEGVALGSLILAADELENGSLVAPFPQAIASRSSYFLARKPDGLQSPLVDRFIDWIVAEMKAFERSVFRGLCTGFGLEVMAGEADSTAPS